MDARILHRTAIILAQNCICHVYHLRIQFNLSHMNIHADEFAGCESVTAANDQDILSFFGYGWVYEGFCVAVFIAAGIL